MFSNEYSLNKEDDITLPEDTLKILQEFYKEQQEKQAFESACIEQKAIETDDNIAFEENWQLSQFWYSNETISEITEICKKIITESKDEIKIALLSSPSLFTSIKNIHKNVKLFEYDERFSAYGNDFVYYDYKLAENGNYLKDFTQYFDLVIADPPFLSDECIQKISIIIKKITKPKSKIMLCSGEVVEEYAKSYLNLKKCNYQPRHNRNLGNEFASFCNFDLDVYT